LCPEVQIRAIMTGSETFGRSFFKRREAQEPFMFAMGPQPQSLTGCASVFSEGGNSKHALHGEPEV
jgi:hypothetical protein